MLHLIVKFQGQIQAEIPLVVGKDYTIGRKPSCDVVIPDQKGVSREHIKITLTELGPLLEVTSKYGNVLANGVEVKSLNLAEGSHFNFLNYEFFILEKSAENSNSKSQNQTLSIPPKPSAADSHEESSSSDYERTIVKSIQVVPHLKMVNVYNEPIELYRLEGGDSWVAGRDPHCHILIKDSKVSRRQFEIKKVNDQYGILDLKSVNGTMVNGSIVSTEALTFLKSGDCITVLSNNFFFELHDVLFKEKVDKIVLPAIVPNSNYHPQTQIYMPPNSLQNSMQGQNQNPNYPMAYYEQQNMRPAIYQAHGGDPQNLNQNQIAPHSFQNKKDLIIAKLKENKLRSGLIGVIAVVLLVAVFSGPSKKSNSRQIANVNQQTNPLTALNEKQQTMVKQSYHLAKNYYMQGRYELARGEIAKLSELIPEYLDSAEIDRLSGEAIALQEQKRRLEVEERQKIEIEQKIQAKVVECRPVAVTATQMDVLEKCLINVLELNPAHPEIEKLRALVDQNRVQLAMRQAQQAENSALAAKLRGMYQRATSAQTEGDRLRAIELFAQVAQSRLPDYGEYKSQARRKIASMKNEMSQATSRYLSEADKSYKDGDLKTAIISLRKARNIDPENDDLIQKIDSYTSELKKQMMTIYQEGVLEESFGNVEGADGKQGAKDKWRRILQLDVTDGEYYRKARTKLKKYGAL